jgi:hypothetical protein
VAELRNRSPGTDNSDAVTARRSAETPRQADTRPRPRETPNRSAETPARPAGTRPHPAETGRPGAPRSGADRMRALYCDPNSTTPDTGPPLRPDRPGRMPGSPDRTPSRSDRTPGRTRTADDIDPRWLAGVPRPPDALPDDTGRAYRAESAHRPDDARPSAKNQPEGESPRDDDVRERLEVWVDRLAFQDCHSTLSPPDRYGDPLKRADGCRVALSGYPIREQARQGELKDCGIIATLGAVAAHRPTEISRRVSQQPDGTCRIRLNEAQWTSDGAAPTGRIIDMSVTPDVPVHEETPDRPAFARPVAGAAWAPLLEKAVAGVDRTWTPDRQSFWADVWQHMCRVDASDHKVTNPRTGPPPTGYVRLNQGSTAWDRAELLTQLTGEESAVRPYPDDPKQLKAALDHQLRNGKPVLVASRPKRHDHEEMPYNLEDSHAYEVVGADDEKIVLRNPWGHQHPEAIRAAEFASNMQPNYATLK